MAHIIPLWQRNDPSAYRPQPARDGPDFWPTIDRHLILALVHFVLPSVPPGGVWEVAAGAGHLVDPLRQAGRQVIATDLFPNRADIARHDFLYGPLPQAAEGAIAITNPPNSRLDAFLVRGLTLIDTGHLSGLVLLTRQGHDVTRGRAAAFNRAAQEWKCCWRSWWKPRQPGDKQPRWTYQWTMWRRDYARLPVTRRLTQAEVEQPELPLMTWPAAAAPPAGVPTPDRFSNALQQKDRKTVMDLDDMDVFDGMRALLDADVDLADRAAVEIALVNACRGTGLSARFVDWCIKAAKANRDAGGLERHAFGGAGFVPPEDATTAETDQTEGTE